MQLIRFHPLPLTIAALIVGALFGYWWGPEAARFGELSKWVITCFKAVATPLLFLAIMDALAKSFVTSRGFLLLLGASAFNAACAVVIALLINNIFHPGRALAFISGAQGSTKIPDTPAFQNIFANLMPANLIEPFLTNSISGVIVLALAFGFAVRRLESDVTLHDSLKILHGLINLAFRSLLTVIHWLVYLVPIAVFCSVAKAVGQNGVGIFNDLFLYVSSCLLGLGLQAMVVYHAVILLHPHISLMQFWREAGAPVFYAFGVNSSLATMPMTLEALDKLGVDKKAARLSACIGTNFNNDGILLYELLAALMIADAYGLQLSLLNQMALAAFAAVAALGVSGFPEAGVIALTLVLTTLKLPTEAIALLLSVDWIIARCRSSVNVLGDFAVALQIDRWLGRATVVEQ